MTDDLQALHAEIEAALAAAADLRAWDAVRVAALGRDGAPRPPCCATSARLRADQRRERGAALNQLEGTLDSPDRGPPLCLGGAELVPFGHDASNPAAVAAAPSPA